MGGARSGWNAKNEWHSQVWEGLKDDPWRILTGFDPLSTYISNALLGRNDEPLGDWFGGPTTEQLNSGDYSWDEHKAANDMKVIIPLVVGGIMGGSFLAGSGAAGGGGGGAAGGGSSATTYALPESYGYGISGGEPVAYGSAPGGGGAGAGGYDWQRWARQGMGQQQPQHQWEAFPTDAYGGGQKGLLGTMPSEQQWQQNDMERERKRLLAQALEAMRTY